MTEFYFIFILLSIAPAGFVKASGPSDCMQGSSNALTNYGTELSLEQCQALCIKEIGCTDINWAPGHQCKTFDGCEDAKDSNTLDHYVSVAASMKYVNHLTYLKEGS